MKLTIALGWCMAWLGAMSVEALAGRVETHAAAARSEVRRDAAGLGTIRCRIRLAEEAPPPPEVAVDKSVEHCGPAIADPVLMVRDGSVANAVAFLSLRKDEEPASDLGHEPSELQLRDEKCLMKPRVVCARRGDVLVLHNTDKIAHNPHGWQPDGKTAFNLSLVDDQLVVRRTLRFPGVYRIDCDIHSWMRAYVHVFDHPWYGISGDEGLVTIEAVPAGSHVLVVWHEVLGTASREVVVAPGEIVDVEFVLDLLDHRPETLIPPGTGAWIPRAADRSPSIDAGGGRKAGH